jgi:hypothetical protein
MKVSKYHLSLLFAFTLPVVLLLLNDHYFKYAYPSFLTGKLSDVVGLAVWFVFFICLFPKYPKNIIISTIVLFVFWKSPYSQPIIAFFLNNFNIKLNRTIDFTDLWALLIIIPFYKYRTLLISTFSNTKKSFKYVYSFVVVLAICATSYSSPSYVIITNYEFKDTNWVIPISKRSVIEKTRLPRNDKKGIDSLLNATLYNVSVEEFYEKGLNKYNVQILLDSVDKTHCKLTLNKLFDFDSGFKIKEFSKKRFISIFQVGFINPVSTKDSVNIFARYNY